MSGSGGQIRQRPNGLWEGRFVGADRRRHSVYGKSKREAQEKLRTALIAADNGIRPVRGRTTVADWLAEWLEMFVRPNVRPRTADSYAETVRRYISPSIGRIPLAKLEPEDISRMLSNLTVRGTLSSTTVRYCYVVLRVALGQAYKSGKVVRNVATVVTPPSKARRQFRPLTAEEARAFLNAVAGDRLAPLYMTAIATGMRQGELLGLRWQDIDLDARSLNVRHTLRLGARTLAEPKTDRGRRLLRLGADVATALREHRLLQLEERLAAGSRWQDGDFVFASSIGTPLDSRNVTHALQAALIKAGLPRQRFHDLRHAYATLMLEDGEELAVISRSLGHANLSTTADVYAHLTPAMLERSAARMDAILGRRREMTG